MTAENILLELNDQQREAVSHIMGPMLVLSAAGTGKTKVLTTRFAYLVATKQAGLSEILAVTFTNKAANEMFTRLSQMLSRIATYDDGSHMTINKRNIWVGTFHSISVRILRAHAETAGLKSDFVIVDTENQMKIIKNILGKNVKKEDFKIILNRILQYKDSYFENDYLIEGKYNSKVAYNMPIMDVYHRYNEKLQELNSVDFSDILLKIVILFDQNQDILEYYQQKFKFVMIDEYQDTNLLQARLINMLAHKHKNLYCVGDDDQSIYGWRGAEVGHILKFNNIYNNAKIVRLEQNYRSTNHILGAASSLIDNNKSRLGKMLWSSLGSGNKINVIACKSDVQEARFICDEIRKLQAAHNVDMHHGVHRQFSTAILVRSISYIASIEKYLQTCKINYEIVSGLKFYNRAEIKDIIAYVKLIIFPYDDLSFERIINKPKRGLGDVTIEHIRDYARANSMPMLKSAKILANNDTLKSRTKTNIMDFIEKIEKWNFYFNQKGDRASDRAGDKAGDTINLSETISNIIHDFGYMEMIKADGEGSDDKIQYIEQLVSVLQDFSSIDDFLESVALNDSIEEEGSNVVKIMTLHAAKGLEFANVFLPVWEEGLFPTSQSSGEISKIEEERRLAYVGITRAKENLYISYCRDRMLYGEISPRGASIFIKELDKEHLNIVYIN